MKKIVPSEKYTFKNHTLTLVDKEMGIDFTESFDPLIIPKKFHDKQKLPGGYTLHAIKRDEYFEEAYFVKRGLIEGQALLFYSKGIRKQEMFYSKGALHGPVTFWGKERQILAKSWYIHGKREGKNWEYYPNGSLAALCRFRQGLSHGNHEFYYPNTQLKSLLPYSQGKLHGVVYLFTEEGKIKFTATYHQGIRDK